MVQKRVNDYVWIRPNQEQIPLKGFKDDEITHLSEVFERTNKHLQHNVHLNGLSIEARKYGPFITHKTGGAYYQGKKDKLVLTHGGPEKYTRASVAGVGTRGVLAHELGHAVSFHVIDNVSKQREWLKTTGDKEKRRFGSRLFIVAGGVRPSKAKLISMKQSPRSVKGRRRQLSTVDENFAEHFRYNLGYGMQYVPKGPVVTSPIGYKFKSDSPGSSYEMKLEHGAQKYMAEHIFNSNRVQNVMTKEPHTLSFLPKSDKRIPPTYRDWVDKKTYQRNPYKKILTHPLSPVHTLGFVGGMVGSDAGMSKKSALAGTLLGSFIGGAVMAGAVHYELKRNPYEKFFMPQEEYQARHLSSVR